MAENVDVYKKVHPLVDEYKHLNYTEKVDLLNYLFETRLLNFEKFDNLHILMSLIIGIFRAYKIKHGDIQLDVFVFKLLKLSKEKDYMVIEWLKNFLPLCESLSNSFPVINTFNNKTAEDFRKQITLILDTLMPF